MARVKINKLEAQRIATELRWKAQMLSGQMIIIGLLTSDETNETMLQQWADSATVLLSQMTDFLKKLDAALKPKEIKNVEPPKPANDDQNRDGSGDLFEEQGGHGGPFEAP